MENLPSDSATALLLAKRAKEHQGDSRESKTAGIDEWGLTDQLLAHVIDLLAISNWQRGGGKSRKPKLMSSSREKRLGRPAPNVDVRAVLSQTAPNRQEPEPDTG